MTVIPVLGDRAENPAVACPELAALFPPGIAAAVFAQDTPAGSLLAAEAHGTGQWSQKRREDFTAGRVCARRALEQFDLGDYPLRVGVDGLPLWPPGLKGSITHTNGYAAAVVGPVSSVRGLGVDSEVIAAVNEEVWAFICTPMEYAALRERAPAQRALHAALTFAAKEAFYKCQYPLTGEWLEFGEVTVALRGSLTLTGEFEILPGRSLLVQRDSPMPLFGRYRIHGPLITAAMALPTLDP